MAMMRLDPRTNAGAAVLFSRSRMAMDLASAAVRDGINAELEIVPALAEALPPVRLGKLEFAQTDDIADLIEHDPFASRYRPSEWPAGLEAPAADHVHFPHVRSKSRREGT